MKKLFVLFLLVALVPFTVGCGLFGDNDDTSTIEFSALTMSQRFAPGGFGGSLRGAAIALNYSDMFMELMVAGNKIRLPFYRVIPNPTYDEVEFRANVLPTVKSEIAGKSVPVTVMIQPRGVTNPAVVVPTANVNVPASVVTSTSPVVVDATNVTQGEVVTAINTANPDTTYTLAPKFIVSSVTFGSTPVSQDSEAPTMIMPTNNAYVFTVVLSEAYANTSAPTFEITVANSSTKVIVGAPVSVSWAADKKTATVTVTPNDTYKLPSGQDYSVTLTKTNAVATSGATATLPKPFYVLAH